ncbi:phage tail protein [Salmonella enterica subsp. enterica]|uniref:Phage tail protein n=1 Tax=Salmonella enterica I TaxID=59201 RepID=A0A5U3F095_SALET|nr:phage tail protein [Salmonella enterica subsp. enterica]
MPASPKFKTIITDYGKQRLIAAMSPGGTKLTLTQMAVGDGGGNPTNPDTTSAALVNEVWRAAVNSVSVDKTHSNIIIVELLIPAEVGGFWIREAGIYDEFNKLVAVCSLPASEKPLLEQGSGRAQTVRMTLVISDMSTINITIDSTTIIATNDYVDNSLKEHEKSRNHPDATLTDRGFVKLYSGVTSMDETMAATPKAVKIAMDNANARLAKERNLADLTNIPLARQSLQLGNSATRNVGATAGTVAAGDDARILATKKAIDDTQTGLAIQRVMWISTADDLSNLPAGARRFARNNDGVTVLPAAAYFFLEVLAKRDSANGSCILATSDTRDVWIGFRYTVPDEANFTWIQLNQNVENLGLKETLNPTKRVSIGNIGTGAFDGSTPSINIGDSDSGFIGSADGVLDIYCNNAKVGYIDNAGLHMLAGIATNHDLVLQSDERRHIIIQNADGSARAYIYKDKDDTGIHINNGVDGWGDFVLGKDSVLYVPYAVRAGGSKKLAIQSDNNSTLSATFNLWGDANRPTVIELDDDQGWHLFSQRNTDGSILFEVNGRIMAHTALHSGDATLATDGNVYGTIWGGWLNDWINNNLSRKNTASLATNGWFRDSSTGWIIQWGITPYAGTTTITVNLPTPFPVGAFMAMGVPGAALYWGEDGASGSAAILNNSQLRVTTDNSLPTAWIAIGH